MTTWAILASAVGAGHATLNTVGADMFIGGVGWDAPPSSTDVHDNVGNGVGTYLRSSFSDDNAAASIFYIRAPATGSSTTITVNPDSGAEGVIFSAWTGSNIPLQTAGGNSGATQVSTITPSSALTPTSAHQLAIFCVGTRPDNAVTGVSVDSGFTLIGTRGASNGNLYTGSLWYLINPPLSALQPVATWSGGNAAACTLTLFGPVVDASGGEIKVHNALGINPTRVVKVRNGIAIDSIKLINGLAVGSSGASYNLTAVVLFGSVDPLGSIGFIAAGYTFAGGALSPTTFNGLTIIGLRQDWSVGSPIGLTLSFAGNVGGGQFISLVIGASTFLATAATVTYAGGSDATSYKWTGEPSLFPAAGSYSAIIN